MTSLIQVSTTDARTNLETTIHIDEGALYIRHDSLDKRLDAQQSDSWAMFDAKPALGPEWTLGLRLPGAALDTFATGATFAEAFGKLMQMWGEAKAQMYIAGGAPTVEEQAYMDACVQAIDGPTGRRC